MTKSYCSKCKHYRYESGDFGMGSYSGCKAVQVDSTNAFSKSSYNGNADKINVNNDCQKFEKGMPRPEIIKAIIAWLFIGGIIYFLIKVIE